MKRGLFTIQTNQELAPATHRMVLAGDTGAITAPGGSLSTLPWRGSFSAAPSRSATGMEPL